MTVFFAITPDNIPPTVLLVFTIFDEIFTFVLSEIAFFDFEINSLSRASSNLWFCSFEL